MNEYMPLNCMPIRWHADRLIDAGEFHHGPERVLDLRPLNCGRFDELGRDRRSATNQNKNGLIGIVAHHPCNQPGSVLEARWLPPHLLKDEGNDSEIPLRTGCYAAALRIPSKWPPGAGWIIVPRIRFLNSVQNAASRVSEVNSTDKGGGSPYLG